MRMSPDVVESLGIPDGDRQPILTITVRNRGRRPVQIQFLRKRNWFSDTELNFTTEPLGRSPL
jgi:hypothetical protein